MFGRISRVMMNIATFAAQLGGGDVVEVASASTAARTVRETIGVNSSATVKIMHRASTSRVW